jgi:hypothetical protein
MGPIELVAGMEVSTYKCGSEECCPHIRYWKGEITEDWSMRIFNDGGDQRGLPPESSMSLSEEDMEKVCRMCHQSVFTQPF